jgi:hypothetical protein
MSAGLRPQMLADPSEQLQIREDQRPKGCVHQRLMVFSAPRQLQMV